MTSKEFEDQVTRDIIALCKARDTETRRVRMLRKRKAAQRKQAIIALRYEGEAR